MSSEKSMEYNLHIADQKVWLKDIRRLSKKDQIHVLDALDNLRKRPWGKELKIKKLQHYAHAGYRFRIGNYRILFDRDHGKNVLYLLRVRHRSQLY